MSGNLEPLKRGPLKAHTWSSLIPTQYLYRSHSCGHLDVADTCLQPQHPEREQRLSWRLPYFKNQGLKPGIVVYAHNLSTWETKAVKSFEFQSGVWARVQPSGKRRQNEPKRPILRNHVCTKLGSAHAHVLECASQIATSLGNRRLSSTDTPTLFLLRQI